MRQTIALISLLFGLACSPASAQSPSMHEGQRIFLQHCGVCHLKIQINVQQSFGPALSKANFANGREAELKGFISNGTPNMPGFKYLLRPEQIDAVVDYLKNTESTQASAR